MIRKIFLTVCLTATAASFATAQIQYSVGLGGGANVVYHYDAEQSFASFNPLITSQLDMQFSRSLGLLVWLDLLNGMSFNPDFNDGYDYRYSIYYLSLSPTLKLCFPRSPLYFFAGPGVGLKTLGKVRQSLGNMSATASIPNMNVRFDARIGAGYDLFLSNRFVLSPFVTYNHGLNGIRSNTFWQANALHVGLIIRYNIY
jgi:hypothetical protein